MQVKYEQKTISRRMGQSLSLEEGLDTPRMEEELGKQAGRKKHNHEFFLSNGNMETMGDLHSSLEAISVSPKTPIDRGRSHYLSSSSRRRGRCR